MLRCAKTSIAVGRRALPKIDPEIEFEQFHLLLDDLTPPFSADRLFGNSNALEIEVGSGKGLFLTNASSANPDRNFLGIEVAKKYARYAAYRLAKNKCKNARMISGDALRFFSEFLPDHCAAAIHVYFPDPWWKERHRVRRVMQESFAIDIARVLKSDGVFHFWTDVEEYFESTCELIKNVGRFGDAIVVEESEASHDMDYRTHFERRMRLNDHPVFRSKFQLSS